MVLIVFEVDVLVGAVSVDRVSELVAFIQGGEVFVPLIFGLRIAVVLVGGYDAVPDIALVVTSVAFDDSAFLIDDVSPFAQLECALEVVPCCAVPLLKQGWLCYGLFDIFVDESLSVFLQHVVLLVVECVLGDVTAVDLIVHVDFRHVAAIVEHIGTAQLLTIVIVV